MLTHRLVSAAIGATILAVVATASVETRGVSSHRTTYVTFGQRVALPGVELAAGPAFSNCRLRTST